MQVHINVKKILEDMYLIIYCRILKTVCLIITIFYKK